LPGARLSSLSAYTWPNAYLPALQAARDVGFVWTFQHATRNVCHTFIRQGH
jgi:hypothetical protein